MTDERTIPDVQTLEWWTCREVGNRYRVDESTVRRWCETGKVPAAKTPGGQWRIHVDAVNAIGAKGLPERPRPQPALPVWQGVTDYFVDDSAKARVRT